ncbi:MAG: hypothetical protein KAU50_05910, partial [Candidatus Marinimicrobia bacterium]|nr:hypothetical protein [Candidatus Neomarinimicrobiota bacterium]
SLDQEAGPFQVLDTASLASAVTFIKQVRYVQLLADPGVSEFATSVINDFPTAIDSVSIELFSLDPAADTLLYESHDTTGLGSGDTYADTTDLASGKLGASLSMVIGLALPTADTTVTVLADTDPKIEITIGLVVGGVDSLAITTAQSAMDLDVSPPPVELPEDIQIIRGLLKDTVMVDPVNEVSLSGLRNRLPFDIDLQIIFPNFSSDSLGSDSLVFGPYLLVNGAPDTADVKDLGGHWFLDPGGEAIDQFEIIVKAVIQEKDVIIPLDGLPMGEFRVTFDVEDMQFAKIEGNFLISFDTVPTSIADIPTGFDGFLFDRLSLELRLYNQIKLPVNLALQLVGKNDRGDSVVVPILAPVNYPGAKSWSGDPAYTVVVLNENSVSTYWLAEGDTTYDQDDLHAVVANEGQSIVDVLNMAPDTLEVGGAALIQGKGQVDLGASVWGTFELIAPFAFILPQPVTFLPVDATPIDTMDSSTRGQIEMALLSSSLTSQITTNFPIGGSVSMLISDSTLFPIFFDQLD